MTAAILTLALLGQAPAGLLALGTPALGQSTLGLSQPLAHAVSIDHPPRAGAEWLKSAGEFSHVDQLADAGCRDAEPAGGFGGGDARHGLLRLVNVEIPVAVGVADSVVLASFLVSDGLVAGGSDVSVPHVSQHVAAGVITGNPSRRQCRGFHRSSLSCLCPSYPCIIHTTSPAASSYRQDSQNNPEIGEIPQKTASDYFCQAPAGGPIENIDHTF